MIETVAISEIKLQHAEKNIVLMYKVKVETESKVLTWMTRDPLTQTC